jgi:hypothetical protein
MQVPVFLGTVLEKIEIAFGFLNFLLKKSLHFFSNSKELRLHTA